ncbi:MAG: alpha-glucuronidase [Bacteroidales bacterium]|nr:alpha-glucuronidase [Bacteroidales bacterium]
MNRTLNRAIASILSVLAIAGCSYTDPGNGHSSWLPEQDCTEAATTLELAETEIGKLQCSATITIDRGLDLENDGFIIKDTPAGRNIYARTETGALYGSYTLQRLERTGQADGVLDIREEPSYERRILNHWDNLDNTVERGYAGWSIWHWGEPVPVGLIKEYARLNASIGINGSVLNNVNATPEMLRRDYIERVAVIADVMRPYGVHVYLSVNFSSPAELGGLATSDPLVPEVREWWAEKVAEIYELIPDFGGFLVKANSEGLPGPQDFGRTHADGANMLAEALEPYDGIVMWRAFVYAPDSADRANQAYEEFVPLDGKFNDNVIVQIKNGPVDFQPREPFSPLFGAMSKTAMMIEFQITQEYMGGSNHLVYLMTQLEECMDSDTFCEGVGSTVTDITTGKLYPDAYKTTAIAGVANIGRDKNWCGHYFAQSSWYGFGRLAWNAGLSSEEIAREWILQTFPRQNRCRSEKYKTEFVEPVLDMMMTSREAAVDYMMPLGLHHIFAGIHHYGPEPWYDPEGARADWLPKYYHQADSLGIGFDRTRSGSGNVDQYHEPLASMYNSLETCPEELLLWFHHVPWTHVMSSGRTLWDEICLHYDRGVRKVREYQAVWEGVRAYVDPERWEAVRDKLEIQESDARWWRDACVQYFGEFSGLPVPQDVEQPERPLAELKAIRLDMKHHN